MVARAIKRANSLKPKVMETGGHKFRKALKTHFLPKSAHR